MKLISDFSRGRAAPREPAVLTTKLQLADSRENCGVLPHLTVPGRKGELLFWRRFYTSPPRKTRTGVTRPQVARTLVLMDSGDHILGAKLKRHKCRTSGHEIDCVDVLNRERRIGKSHTKAERILIKYLRAYLARREQQLRQPRLLHRDHLMQSPCEMENIPYLSVPSASAVGEGNNLIFERRADTLCLRPVHVAHPLFPTLTRTRMVVIACGDVLDASRPIGHLSRDQQILIECVRAHLARSSQMSVHVSPRIKRVVGQR